MIHFIIYKQKSIMRFIELLYLNTRILRIVAV